MRQKTARGAQAAGWVLCAALLFPLAAQAQGDSSLRRPVTTPEESPDFGPPPVPLKFKSPARQPAPAQGGAASGGPASGGMVDEPRPAKFPNIDTAKNRRDYELSTPKAGGIAIGRDEDTGDTVMGTTPRRKTPPADPAAAQPIVVQPRVRY